MNKISFGMAALMLLIAGTSASAQIRACDPASNTVWKSSEETLAKFAEPLKHFNNGVERVRRQFKLPSSIYVIPVDCPYLGEDVFTRRIFETIPMYGIYVDVSYLKYTGNEELERRGTTEMCMIQSGEIELNGPNYYAPKRRSTQRCIAIINNDQEALRWLDRTEEPESYQSRSARVDKMMDDARKRIQQYLQRQ